jgi:hypothetical protein
MSDAGEPTSIARKLYPPDTGGFNTYRRGLRKRSRGARLCMFQELLAIVGKEPA